MSTWSYRNWQPGGERTALGDVTFDSTIHCGNAHDFRCVGAEHFRFRARCGLAPYSWRFLFRIDSPGDGREVTLEVADFNHFGQELWQEQAAVISRDGNEWSDLGTDNIEIVPWTPTGEAEGDGSVDDGWHPPYGVRYRLRLDAPSVWIASPTPFTLEHLGQYADALTARCTSFSCEEIGRSHYGGEHGHPPLLVRAGKSGGDDDRIRVVVLGGEHPAESAGMYACEGMMEEVLRASDLLSDFSFWFVPAVNVDGVAHGQTYHNTNPYDPAEPGVNIARDWKDRTQPEVQAVWELIQQVKPHCIISLHNGRHRRAYEICCPPQPHLATLMAHFRKHLPVPLEHWRPYNDEGALPVVALKQGIAESALCFETLLLRKLPGCSTFAESYRRTGMFLLRGLVGGLRESHGKPHMLALREPLGSTPQLCNAADFVARLPEFYYGPVRGRIDEHDTWSLEINGLPLLPGHYDVWLETRADVGEMRVAGQDRTWSTHRPEGGWALLSSMPVPARMARFEFEHAGDELPFERVLVCPEGMSRETALGGAEPYTRYVRDILSNERRHLANWAPFHEKLMSDGFGADQLQRMFDEIVDWVAGRQVTESGDPYFGAIWSEEDKYDARDAAAAAACFARRHQRTGEQQWLDRALMAREYAYRNQMCEPGNSARDGGFVHMVHGIWGLNFSRLEPPYPGIDGVDTCIIIHQLCRAAELGLPLEETDREAIWQAASWVAANEPLPGMFLHHEGATHDCQNSNALAIGALTRAHHTLTAAGVETPDEWLQSAARGVEHYLSGQEAIGVWPYWFAAVGQRAGQFHFSNIPDHGIGLYHLTRALGHAPLGLSDAADLSLKADAGLGMQARPALIEDNLEPNTGKHAAPIGAYGHPLTPPTRAREDRLADALLRAARWYLCISRLDEDTIDLEYDMKPELGGDICFSGFTWCRFTAAATLLRIGRLSGETEPWKHLALRLMEHVHRKRWQRDDRSHAPVVSHARPEAKLATWCQAAEWDAAMLGEMIDDLGEM